MVSGNKAVAVCRRARFSHPLIGIARSARSALTAAEAAAVMPAETLAIRRPAPVNLTFADVVLVPCFVVVFFLSCFISLSLSIAHAKSSISNNLSAATTDRNAARANDNEAR